MSDIETPDEQVAVTIEELVADDYDPSEDGDDSTPPEERPT